MPERFLHDHPDFKSLLEITSREEEILEPSLVEKDYWIMHVLWGLSAQGLKYELKGGTSLSKGLKDGILLEVGFDRTQPSTKRLISSWAYDRGASSAGSILDNRAVDVACYRPEYTFVEKIQTVM